MRTKLNFYLFITALAVLDAVLIRSPNLVGKIGLLIYKYHYLRTFPKALITVSILVVLSICITEVIHFAVKKNVIRKTVATILMILLCVASLVLLVKTGLDFSKGMYSHTGLRFRSGAYLLPAILMVIFIYGWITLPRPFVSFPESPLNPGPETGQGPEKNKTPLRES